MKTYPHQEGDGIIELVRKDEHDAVVRELTNTHSILDGDESKIIRNTKDGYPEGREARVLTLAERVKSLCIYAADWKRWTEEKEAELTRWQSLAERLATALDNLSHDSHNHAKDIQKIRWGYDGDCGAKLSAEQIEECCDAANPALAAYESAKSGNLPDPLNFEPHSSEWYRARAEECRHNGKTVTQYNHFLALAEMQDCTLAEAVKRMEAVPITTLIDAYFTASDSCDDVAFNAIRARLISAAKGEQP